MTYPHGGVPTTGPLARAPVRTFFAADNPDVRTGLVAREGGGAGQSAALQVGLPALPVRLGCWHRAVAGLWREPGLLAIGLTVGALGGGEAV